MIDTYQARGFVVAGPILEPTALAEARVAVDALHARALAGEQPLASDCVFERSLPDRKRGGVRLEGSEDAVFIVGDPPRYDPFFLPVMLNEQLIDLVQALLGTADVVAHFANITSKAPAFGSGVAWHRDHPNGYISPASPDMLRTMICLDGMSAENGATRFIAGSHRDPAVTKETVVEGDGRIVTAACEAGAVVAIHPLVLHGGPPNHSTLPRRNLVVQWGRGDAPLVTTARESITGLTVGELRRTMAETSPYLGPEPFLSR